jgi:Na+-transporting NADH:ubiquinone oxidoreductase subunit NqrE
VFIVVIAGLVQIVEIVMQKFTPPLYRALGSRNGAEVIGKY